MHSFLRDACLNVSPPLVRLLKRFRARKDSFSQFGEDIVLWNLLNSKTDGFYVDCGAYDPFIFSNTAKFYEAGWSGINIEPQRSRWTIFQKLRTRDINLCELVSDSQQETLFFEASMPTMSGIYTPELGSSRQGKSVKRLPLTLAHIIDTYAPGRYVDFLSVDCEGHDLNVLRSNNWSKTRLTYLVVEDHDKSSCTPLDSFLFHLDYKPLIRLGASKIYCAA